MALSVPLSRFTPRVGGGSAFFVRHHATLPKTMKTWLKLIGSQEHPITEAPWHGSYTDEHIGFRKIARPSIRAGDHMFLYAPGGSRRIFALAEVVSDPERDPKYTASMAVATGSYP